MGKNLMPKIAEMLGVEIGEEFKVKGHYKLTYKFNYNGLRATYDDGAKMFGTIATDALLIALLRGESEIVKRPWKPKEDEVFYTFLFDFKDDGDGYVWRVSECFWDDSPVDFALLKAGWVFRTRKEAQTALPDVAKELRVECKL